MIKVNQDAQSEQTSVNSDEPQYHTQEELERHKPKIINPKIKYWTDICAFIVQKITLIQSGSRLHCSMD